MDEIEKIKQFYKEGVSTRVVAEKLGVTISTVNLWQIKLGLREKGEGVHRRILRTREEVEAIYDMSKTGYTDTKIASKLGRSLSFVGNIRRELGLKPNWIPGDGFRAYHNSDEKIAFKHKIINLYHKNPDWDWIELVKGVGLDENKKNLTKVKTIVGLHLMRVCRSQEACAFKALLPENTGIEEY